MQPDACSVARHPEPEVLPPYCCVILRDGSQTERIFVEQRGADADVAANTLTCWGGKREPRETPLACIVRECTEEMGWAPHADTLERACDLCAAEPRRLRMRPHWRSTLELPVLRLLLPPPPPPLLPACLLLPPAVGVTRHSLVLLCPDRYVDGQLVAWFYAGPAPDSTQAAALHFEAGRSGVWAEVHDQRISPWHKTVLRAWCAGASRADHLSPSEEEAKGTAELLTRLARRHANSAE